MAQHSYTASIDHSTPARLLAKPTWLLSQTSAHAHRLLTQALERSGSRGYHYRLLAALAEFGPTDQTQLGNHAKLDRSDVVAALDELAARGLIERAPDPANRRRNIVALTAAGKAKLRELDKILTRVQNELLEPLSPTQRDQFVRALARLLDHHESRASEQPD